VVLMVKQLLADITYEKVFRIGCQAMVRIFAAVALLASLVLLCLRVQPGGSGMLDMGVPNDLPFWYGGFDKVNERRKVEDIGLEEIRGYHFSGWQPGDGRLFARLTGEGTASNNDAKITERLTAYHEPDAHTQAIGSAGREEEPMKKEGVQGLARSLAYGGPETRRRVADRLLQEDSEEQLTLLINTVRSKGYWRLRIRCLEVLGMVAASADRRQAETILNMLFPEKEEKE
jgi:hypothetical protein